MYKHHITLKPLSYKNQKNFLKDALLMSSNLEPTLKKFTHKK